MPPPQAKPQAHGSATATQVPAAASAAATAAGRLVLWSSGMAYMVTWVPLLLLSSARSVRMSPETVRSSPLRSITPPLLLPADMAAVRPHSCTALLAGLPVDGRRAAASAPCVQFYGGIAHSVVSSCQWPYNLTGLLRHTSASRRSATQITKHATSADLPTLTCQTCYLDRSAYPILVVTWGAA